MLARKQSQTLSDWKEQMRTIAAALLLLTLPLIWVQSLRTAGHNASGNLPEVVYLGEGGAYTIDPDWNFIVKRIHPFRFDLEPGPSYSAAGDEQVWKTDNEAPPALYHAWLDLGYAPGGCIVSYVAIDDDIDDRVNTFYLDGNPIHEIPQGMVTRGEFSVPSAGNLTFYAADSVGMWMDVCRHVIPPTEEPTNTPTSTATPSSTPTVTPTSTATNTPTPTTTASPTPTDTPTNTPTSTPTPPTPEVLPPEITVTPITVTPTIEPRPNACLRINFELGGDVAREGLYIVREVGGRELFRWFAAAGWEDSGWVDGIDISHSSVYVEVFFYPGDGRVIKMEIVNPAPGTEYGWLSRGMCHAIEVAWPD
jgi:hypothetical protein